MRLSDWSSDVCSSDLAGATVRFWRGQARFATQCIRAATTDEGKARGREDLAYAWDWYRRAQAELAEAKRRAATTEQPHRIATERAEERPGGKEGVRTCRSRGPAYKQKKKNIKP